jgi:hypothetical protein
MCRKVMGSYLDQQTGYPDEGFTVFLSPFRQMPGYHLQLTHDSLVPHPFPFIIKSSIKRTKQPELLT